MRPAIPLFSGHDSLEPFGGSRLLDSVSVLVSLEVLDDDDNQCEGVSLFSLFVEDYVFNRDGLAEISYNFFPTSNIMIC